MKKKIEYIIDEIVFFIEDIPKIVKILLLILLLVCIGFGAYRIIKHNNKPTDELGNTEEDVQALVDAINANAGQSLVLYGQDEGVDDASGGLEDDTLNESSENTGSVTAEEENQPEIAIVGEEQITEQSDNIYKFADAINIKKVKFNDNEHKPTYNEIRGVGATVSALKEVLGSPETMLHLQDAVFIKALDDNTFVLKTAQDVPDNNVLILRLYSNYPDSDLTLDYYRNLKQGQLCFVDIPVEDSASVQDISGLEVLVVSYKNITVEDRDENDYVVEE